MRLKNRTTSKQGGYSYMHPYRGVEIGPFVAIDDLFREVKQYDKVNALAPTPEWLVEQQICAKYPECCRPSTQREMESEAQSPVPWNEMVLEQIQPTKTLPPADAQPLSTKLKFKDVLRATRVLARWVIRGRKKVSAELASQRAQTCLSCPMHAEIVTDRSPGCCGGDPIKKLVTSIVGNSPGFVAPSNLQACAACKCVLEAKVQIPIEFFKDLGEQLPDNCWVMKESAYAKS